MPAVSERQNILLLGDSLTQLCFDGAEGWGRSLANRYQRRADVLNRGMSGYNTRWYLKYAETNRIWNEAGKAVLVTIWFGANDAATLEQHVPLSEYQTNLEIIVDKARESYPHAKILIVTPLPSPKINARNISRINSETRLRRRPNEAPKSRESMLRCAWMSPQPK